MTAPDGGRGSSAWKSGPSAPASGGFGLDEGSSIDVLRRREIDGREGGDQVSPPPSSSRAEPGRTRRVRLEKRPSGREAADSGAIAAGRAPRHRAHVATGCRLTGSVLPPASVRRPVSRAGRPDIVASHRSPRHPIGRAARAGRARRARAALGGPFAPRGAPGSLTRVPGPAPVHRRANSRITPARSRRPAAAPSRC